MTDDAKNLVKRIRRFSKLPIAVGFGISTPEQFAAVGKFAEAAVVGSAIVHSIEQNPGREAESVSKFVRQLSAVSHQLISPACSVMDLVEPYNPQAFGIQPMMWGLTES